MSPSVPAEGLLTAAHCWGDVRGENQLLLRATGRKMSTTDRENRDGLWGELSAALGEATLPLLKQNQPGSRLD